ncbi:MAG: thioredoxin family protein [Magnetococcales bacterium]|nr:thioredoxin family protein [Magnetococcales bacterium]
MSTLARWIYSLVMGISLLVVSPASVMAEVNDGALGRLIVFTTEYCPYCQEFMRTVGPVYAKTEVGRRYPMEMVDNFSPSKEWETRVWEIRFYPTFLLLDGQGRELGRFRGYRGEEPFWSELETIARREPKP